MVKTATVKKVSRARIRATPRINDPERTRANILKVATRYFAERGFSGARVDEIGELTKTSKRMIYYYFGDKEGLYLAVLEKAYLGIRRIEGELDTEIEPEEAIRQITAFTFDHHAENPEFARLVQIENIHRAASLKTIPGIREHNAPVIEHLAKLIRQGEEAGVFRPGLDPVDLHWIMSALALFNICNEATFSYLYGRDGHSPEGHAARRAMVVDTVVRWCRVDPLCAA